MERCSWDKFFMDMAELVSVRGTCDRKYVGAVLVKNARVISIGYNGSLPGFANCNDPETFWQCNNCGKKTENIEETEKLHNISCAGYGWTEKHGGHDMENGSCQRTVHGEINAIAQAARLGIKTEGTTLYCNTLPCWPCMKAIVTAGIKEVIYRDEYRPEMAKRVKEAASSISGFILRRFIPA